LPAPTNSRAEVYHASALLALDSLATRTLYAEVASHLIAGPASEPASLVLGCAPMRVVEKRQLLSAEEIARTLQRLAHEIVEKSGGTDDLAFVGVRRRGVPLSERLAKTILDFSKVKVPVGTIDITLYRDDLSTVGPQPIVHSNEIEFSVDNRDLVIVDDVLYTGRTIRAAMNGLFDLGRPKRIRLCVLIDRGHRELPVEASFIGSKVQTSDTEIVEVHLKEIDGDERVVLVDRVD
jgi:pyrimidine operon attenuation protein/uracil phosphoribosyltransferase